MAEVTRLRVEEVAVERPPSPTPTIAPPGLPIEQATQPAPPFERPFTFATPAYTPTTIPITHRGPSDEAMEAAFKAVGFALSARALLFLALVGSFVLALLAMTGNSSRLWVLGTYCILVILPLVFLEVRKGR